MKYFEILIKNGNIVLVDIEQNPFFESFIYSSNERDTIIFIKINSGNSVMYINRSEIVYALERKKIDKK